MHQIPTKAEEKGEGEMSESWLFKVVPIFIGFVFVCMVLGFVAFGIAIFQGSKEVSKVGLKGVVERIWEGETK